MFLTDPQMGVLVLAVGLALTLFFLVYGLNGLYLMAKSRKFTPAPRRPLKERPRVAIHIPIYNEFYVVGRVLEACVQVAAKYGKELVKIYVIDDSTDETGSRVDGLVERFSEDGFGVEVLRRGSRRGFKAGALKAALEVTSEPYVAILDADFVPPPDFLDRTIALLEADPTLGFVQAKWGHLDRNYNLLTGSLAIGIDAHFLMEQQGRNSGGYFMVFNGSAGVLRTSAVREAGGWDEDTLTEDLDLSYRIQLAGFRGAYISDLEVPAELPPSVTGLKRQQGRWARGYMQTAKKLLGSVRRSKSLTRGQKVEAGIHLTNYLVQPVMVASFLLVAFAALMPLDISTQSVMLPVPSELANMLGVRSIQVAPWSLFPLFVVFTTLLAVYYSVEVLRAEGLGVAGSTKQVALLVILGYGMSINNSVHAMAGLISRETGSFLRTPKYALTKAEQSWRKMNYQLPFNRVSILEAGAVVLASAAVLRSLATDNLAALPVLAFYLAGYGSILALTLSHSLGRSGSSDR